MSEVLARPRRSYSRLDTYQQCPEMYRWKYVEKVPEQPSVWSAGGTAFHTVAEQYLRGDIGTSDDALFVAWMEAWGCAVQDMATFGASLDLSTWRAADRGRENAAWWQENGYAMVKRFVRWKQTTGAGLHVFEVDGYPYLEAVMEVELGGVPVIAIPDALVLDEHGQLNIVDYKTGKPPKKPTQLRVYSTVVDHAIGMDVTWGLYYMARPGQLLAHDLSRHDHDEVIDWFVDFDTRERAGDYKPTPGPACKFCPFKPRCSYYNPENA